MFIIIVISLFAATQLYLLLKARRYIRNVFPDKWKTAAYIALVLFFVWMSTPIFYNMLGGSVFRLLSPFQLYGFAYPFFIWISTNLFLIPVFIAKDLILLLWKGIKSISSWYFRQLPCYNPEKHAKQPEKVNPGRRKFLQIASAGLIVPPLSITSYGLIFGSRDYDVNEIELSFPNLPENLRGLKIVQFCDIHCSQYTPKSDVAKAVSIINGINADLVLLPGDFVPNDAGYIFPCVEAIKEIKAKFGVFASLGNHEEWTDPVLVTKTLEENGIPVLRNAGMTLDIRGEKLNLLGVDDSRWGNADLERALQMVPEGNFNLLMSHQPPFWDIAGKRGIDLTLAGHTHGGQFALKMFGGKISLGEFFHKYNQGLFKNSASQLFVTTGFGFTGPPIRFNVPPEVVVITLV